MREIALEENRLAIFILNKTEPFFTQRTELPLLKINTATEKETLRLHVNMKVQSTYDEGRPGQVRGRMPWTLRKK